MFGRNSVTSTAVVLNTRHSLRYWELISQRATTRWLRFEIYQEAALGTGLEEKSVVTC